MKKNKVFLTLSMVISSILLIGCNNTPTEDIKIVTLSYGDNIFRQEKVKKGEEFKKPSDPIKEGYDFANWYYNPACSGYLDVSFPLIINDDITLYCKWNIKQLTVTFHTNNDEETEFEQVVPYKNRAYDNYDKGSKEGYVFDRWCYDEELQHAYNFSNLIIADLDLYGKWKQA